MKVSSHDFEMTLEHRSGYLYVKIAAQSVSAEMLQHLLTIAAPYYRDQRVAAVMIERDVPVPLTKERACFIIETLARTLPSGHKIGYVDTEQDNRQALETAIAAVDHDDGVRFGVFAAETEAEGWLTRDRQSPA